MKLEIPFFRRGILGLGLSLEGGRLRVARGSADGSRCRVTGLCEGPAADTEAAARLLRAWGVPAQASAAVNLPSERLKVLWMGLPAMDPKAVPQALTFQFQKDCEDPSEEWALRYLRLPVAPEAARQPYLVCALPRGVVESTRKEVQALGLRPKAGEPLPLSLLAWQDKCFPPAAGSRVLLYLGPSQGLCMGFSQGRFSFARSFARETPAAERSEEERFGETLKAFQQGVEDFVLQENLGGVRELVLAGAWEPGQAESVSAFLGIARLRPDPERLGASYVGDAGPEEITRYAAELALAGFPRGDL